MIAQENLSLQGCRRGTPRPQSTHFRRSGGEERQPGGDFYHGERHQLTVLVAFNDRSFVGDEAATLNQWNKIFNADSLNKAPFNGSVHDYFMAQSYGVFNVVFDLVYVQVSGNAGHGMNDSKGSNLIWPHQWWMSEQLKDRQENIYREPISVSAGEKNYLVDCYCALNELRKEGDYGSFGTICHA